MKKISIILILLTGCFILKSNSSYGQIKFYNKINCTTIESYGFDLTLDGIPIKLCSTLKGVVSVTGGKINVDLWQITNQSPCTGGIDSSTKIGKLEIIDKRSTYGDPTKVLKLPFRSRNFGVNTLPFRYRFPIKANGVHIPGIGTSNFSLAANFGYTIGMSRITTRAINNRSLTFGVYLGPSTTDLKQTHYKDQSKWSKDQVNATMAYGANIIVARNSFGIVFAIGSENALGKNANQWIYNSKPYFAFGINTGFGKL